jgi:DNA-binding NtrC family response regulator
LTKFNNSDVATAESVDMINSRILVVDDDKTVRDAIAEFLNDQGFITDTAEDAKTAVAGIKAVRYDIVVMEVTLPIYAGGYSGLYLLNYINNRYPMIETIVVTGDTTIETGMESIRLGASGWMTKPFSLSVLKTKISAILKLKNVLAMTKGPFRNQPNC